MNRLPVAVKRLGVNDHGLERLRDGVLEHHTEYNRVPARLDSALFKLELDESSGSV